MKYSKYTIGILIVVMMIASGMTTRLEATVNVLIVNTKSFNVILTFYDAMCNPVAVSVIPANAVNNLCINPMPPGVVIAFVDACGGPKVPLGGIGGGLPPKITSVSFMAGPPLTVIIC